MHEAVYRLLCDPSLSPSPVLPALVWAEGVRTAVVPTEGTAALVRRVQETGEEFIPAATRRRVRGMLRHGKYKPSGRGKPASEFLLRTALDGSFPSVNGPVDINNLISLESGLPGSIFDVGQAGRELLLRRGAPGEAYVFNPSGQSIDLEDLLVVCRRSGGGWEPCGNPVKDAMATKVRPETQDVVAVLYAPIDEGDETVRGWAERFAELLSQGCEARSTGVRVGFG